MSPAIRNMRKTWKLELLVDGIDSIILNGERGNEAPMSPTIRNMRKTWKLELLVDGIDSIILNWIKEGKFIYLYGVTNMEWIRKFTTIARVVASTARIPLEMVYMGKSKKREQVRKCTTTIIVEKLSYCWQDLTMVWFFWTRLESMMFSKIQLGSTIDVDPMLREIKKLVSYEKKGGWAILSNESFVFVNGHNNTVLLTFTEYNAWKDNVPPKGLRHSLHGFP